MCLFCWEADSAGGRAIGGWSASTPRLFVPFRVQGTGFRVQGSGHRVQGSGFRVQGAGYRVQGSGSRGSFSASDAGWDVGCGVWG